MGNKENALEYAYQWLALRLRRAAYVEEELLTLVSSPLGVEANKKRYDELVQDNKAMSLKEVVAVVESLQGEEENVVGFEDFE